MRAPCLGCEDRTVVPNCHMGCKRYQEYATEREKIRQEHAKRRAITDILIHNTRENAAKSRR